MGKVVEVAIIDALDRFMCCRSSRLCSNNPVVEYQSESFRMFNDMIGSIEDLIVTSHDESTNSRASSRSIL